MIKQLFLTCLLTIAFFNLVIAQQQDSTLSAKSNQIDIKQPSVFTPEPNKALLLGLLIPGGGQIYNRRWWKLPIVYAAYGGLIYAIDYNNGFFRRFSDAFQAEVNSEVHEFTGSGLSANALRSLRNKFDKQLQLSYIGLVLVHGLIGAEAFVDAHLRSFDIDDDLSILVKPDLQLDPLTQRAYPAVSLVFQFK